MSNLVTANGKEIAIVNAPGTGHYKIQFTTGGELPQVLTGLYTSAFEADKAARNYVEQSKQVKPKTSKEA